MNSSHIWWGVLNLFTVLVYAFLFAPIAVVVILSFNAANFGSFPISGVSFKWFAKLLENQAIVGAFITSLVLGVLTAVISTTVALFASMALCRHRIAAKKPIGMLMIAPLLVPETVLAVGLLLLLRTLDLPRTFGLLLAGHVLITLPFAAMVIQAHLTGLGRAFEDAAASLGAKPLWVLVEVTLPLSLPAIVAALLFTFTISFDNLTASLFWRPSGVETVPTQVFAMLRDSVSPEINALGTVMIVITLTVSLAAGVLSRVARGSRGEPQGQGSSSPS